MGSPQIRMNAIWTVNLNGNQVASLVPNANSSPENVCNEQESCYKVSRLRKRGIRIQFPMHSIWFLKGDTEPIDWTQTQKGGSTRDEAHGLRNSEHRIAGFVFCPRPSPMHRTAVGESVAKTRWA
jgi:hypothetical protein